MTLVGDPDGPKSDTGLVLREGTAATLRNFIVMGFNASGLDIDTESSITLANNGDLSVQNSIFFNNAAVDDQGVRTLSNFSGDGDGIDEGSWATTSGFNNSESDPDLRAPYSLRSPSYQPSSSSPAVDGTVPVASPPSDGFCRRGGLHRRDERGRRLAGGVDHHGAARRGSIDTFPETEE